MRVGIHYPGLGQSIWWPDPNTCSATAEASTSEPDTPLRPIVSFISSPTYRLSKFLASLLKPVVGQNVHHVRNSQQFAEFITSQQLPSTEVLVSFDVVSLFTRVPTPLAVRVSRKRLENDPTLPQRTSLSVDEICSLLNLCLEATYLMFDGQVYQQVHGTAMGSPVSVIVANLVMEDIQERALSSFHAPPRFWRRYVDDTCTALPRDLVTSFHEHLNNIDRNIPRHGVYWSPGTSNASRPLSTERRARCQDSTPLCCDNSDQLV